jgi:excisionase family DNA binding protein
MASPAPDVERLLYRPNEAATALGISRSKLYVLMASGQIESVQVGTARRIPIDALRSFIARLRNEDVTSGGYGPLGY